MPVKLAGRVSTELIVIRNLEVSFAPVHVEHAVESSDVCVVGLDTVDIVEFAALQEEHAGVGAGMLSVELNIL